MREMDTSHFKPNGSLPLVAGPWGTPCMVESVCPAPDAAREKCRCATSLLVRETRSEVDVLGMAAAGYYWVIEPQEWGEKLCESSQSRQRDQHPLTAALASACLGWDRLDVDVYAWTSHHRAHLASVEGEPDTFGHASSRCNAKCLKYISMYSQGR